MQHIIRFLKMHVLGQDCVVSDRLQQSFFLDSVIIRNLAQRRSGIGFDRFVLIESPLSPHSDFVFCSYNSQGIAPGFCLNSARTVMHYVHDAGLIKKKTLEIYDSVNKISVTADRLVGSVSRLNISVEKAPYLKKSFSGLDYFEMSLYGQTYLLLHGYREMGKSNAIDDEMKKKIRALVAMEAFSSAIVLVIYEENEGLRIDCFDSHLGRLPLTANMAVAVYRYHTEKKVTTMLRLYGPYGYFIVSSPPDSMTLTITAPIARVYQGEFLLKYANS